MQERIPERIFVTETQGKYEIPNMTFSMSQQLPRLLLSIRIGRDIHINMEIQVPRD